MYLFLISFKNVCATLVSQRLLHKARAHAYTHTSRVPALIFRRHALDAQMKLELERKGSAAPSRPSAMEPDGAQRADEKTRCKSDTISEEQKKKQKKKKKGRD